MISNLSALLYISCLRRYIATSWRYEAFKYVQMILLKN